MHFKLFFSAFILAFFGLCQSYGAPRNCVQLIGQLEPVSHAVKNNLFVTVRTLQEYQHGLHPDFKMTLGNLTATDTWIDLGGGKGNAVEDYLKTHTSVAAATQTVLVTYKLSRFFGIKKYDGKLKLLEGRLFEDIPLMEIPNAKLMTDFFGVLSYTRDLTQSLNMIFNRLTLGGELYIHSSPMYTTIVTYDGPIGLQKFLELVPGIKVEGRAGVIKVTKILDIVTVPKLKLVRIDEATLPAFRRFEVIEE